MQIKITSDPQISPKELKKILNEEKALYIAQGKTLAEIELSLADDEIIVKSYAASPIRRIRRITGYLSEEHNFNNAKQAELSERISHAYI